VYADVAASTGWTWEYIGQCLTLPRLEAMYAHWRRFPPVHVSAALFAGTGKAETTAPARKQAANDEPDEATAAYIRSMGEPMKARLPGK
jgi:hypothetical protein